MDKEILKKNIEANGEYIELQVLEEECAELIQAVSKGIRYGFTYDVLDNFIEECADVSIAMAQAMEILEVEDSQYKQKIKEKLDRMLKRLEESENDMYKCIVKNTNTSSEKVLYNEHNDFESCKKEFSIVSNCDICGEKETLCKEEIVTTKDGRQKMETWCKKCYEEAVEEIAKKNEEAMYEVYEDIIRSSH